MNEPRELSLADLVAIARRSGILIVSVPALGAVAAYAIASLLTPTYRASTLLSHVQESGNSLSQLAAQFSPLTQLVGDFDGSGGLSAKDVHLATLRSRWLTEQFIRDKNLLPVLFPDEWDSAARDWKMENGKREPPPMGAAFQLFDDKIRFVSEDRSTGLVSLAVEWHDRSAVAEWSNDLVARANEFLRARVIAESRRSIEFLEAELEKTTVVERRQIIYRLIESKTSDIMLANSRDGYSFVVVDPAVEPDDGDYVRPRRVVLAMIGLFAGFVIAFVIATVRWARRTEE